MPHKVVLTADKTLFSEYRNVPLLQFLGCAPREKVPKFLFDVLSPYSEMDDGTPRRAPYDVRLVEAVLVNAYGRENVTVTTPKALREHVRDGTEVLGISTMDPLGLGPVTMMFTNGGHWTGYTKFYFIKLMEEIKRLKSEKGFKVVVGGPGAWQLLARESEIDRLGIDHVVEGETEHVLPDIIDDIVEGRADKIIKVRGYPSVEQIPNILGATLHGLLEVNRGCGRNCEYCSPNLRSSRNLPVDHILKNIDVNVRNGVYSVWAQSEDIFLYRLEDHRYMRPNWDALIELFSSIVNHPGVRHTNPTHGTISAPASDPERFAKLSAAMRSGPDNIIGLQPGLETGSVRLAKLYMPRKALPFSVDEWPEVVFNGTMVLNMNYWVPAFTAITGMPGETKDDVWDTIRLIDRMERELPEKVGPKAHWTVTVLSFVPLAGLSGEGFFDISESLTEERFYLIYRTWRHTVLETESFLPHVVKNPLTRRLFTPIFRYGARKVLEYMEAWGRSKGYDAQKAIAISA